ncbi:hypothetical protein A1O1_06031 [Capronia coronata CBS 617.96]|uniref:FRG1-like family protein n=1 Tax=Capronia coronata CBS 617.96 TaxID=1182541 RepID=W9Y7P6_9EURO|nr:uncharacterized protein A1O1_06031 [Capronia coronata CBS 617.96]EXJ85665.1 hypothetical protein A1O1_06031 [Capronia coronata CBS 617.96]
MPVKPLTFKGDKKAKKRKHRTLETADEYNHPQSQNTSIAHPPASSQGGGALTTTTTTTIQPSSSAADHDPSEDDSWTTPDAATDIAGPTLIVLPTTPPTCLASDAHGNVFASPLENIVDNYPETAEPHDVRQVWVASTVAGTGGQINLKGSHGGFLSCDRIGVLGARREARGLEEGFMVEPVMTGTDNGNNDTTTTTTTTTSTGGVANARMRWRIRTSATKTAEGDQGKRYICAVVTGGDDDNEKEDGKETAEKEMKKKTIAISLRGDGDADSESTYLVLKMQARFKPRLMQNKETKAREKVSRRELEQAVGRKLEDDEVRRLKRARKEGTYYEEILDVRVKGKHDKFAS